MSTCTFFGHRDCPETIKQHLREVLRDLIVTTGVDQFYVGHQGRFDGIVRSVLRELVQEYPDIHYAVVLAYLPGRRNESADTSDTILPEGIEAVPPRYAIAWRNRWMLMQSDYVVVYCTHPTGGTAQYYNKAVAAKKRVFNLATML